MQVAGILEWHDVLNCLVQEELETGTSASMPRTANALETLNSEMLVDLGLT